MDADMQSRFVGAALFGLAIFLAVMACFNHRDYD